MFRNLLPVRGNSDICKSKAVEICCNNCGLGYSGAFIELPCATPLEQWQLLFPAHLSHFPLHVVPTENMDKASGIPKWAGESEVGNTTNPTHHAQVLFGLLPFLVSIERISRDQGVLQDHAAWDTELISKGCALLINDPGIAEGFRENFSILKLVLEFLQKWKGMAKLCPRIEGYWRNLVGGCVCIYMYVCPGSLPTINFNKR